METRFLEADVLIIGGGSAGCMAANRIKDLNPQLKVVIFEKGDIKYSGSIARGMDALNVVAIPNFTTPELFVESNTLACGGIWTSARLMKWPGAPSTCSRSWKLGRLLSVDEKETTARCRCILRANSSRQWRSPTSK
jgi:hypothetical protein